MNEEGMQTTENDRIFVGRQIEFDEETFEQSLHELEQASNSESRKIRRSYIELFPNTNTANKEERPWTQEET